MNVCWRAGWRGRLYGLPLGVAPLRAQVSKAVVIGLLLLMLPSALHGATPVQQQLNALTTAAQGKRVGLITNPSGCDEVGNLDADYLLYTNGVSLTVFFAPEHGLRGTLPPGQAGGDYIDPQTGIPVYAVYGTRNAPTDSQLTNVDLLVFDLQDVGARFYTFVWTMTYCMEAAARNGKPFYVIDRPNPIGGMRVEGAPNTVDYGLIGRLGQGASFGVATRHGMTAGEIAWMWNSEWMSPKVELHVLTMPNWSRSQWWIETGRVFVPPSPNMRTTNTATVYPGTCIFEGSNLSVGRGTDKPFEKMGAPFVNGSAWANCLYTNGLPGVRFDPITFTPTNYPGAPWLNQSCGGVQVVVTNRDTFDPIRTGLVLLQTVCRMYPAQASVTSYAAKLMGVPGLDTSIMTGDINATIAGWQANLAQFRALRRRYLLYPEDPPLFQSIRVVSPVRTQMALAWTALNGRSYRLYSRANLSAPWNTTNDYTGTGNTVTVTDAVGVPGRFYGLELLP